MVIIRLVIPVKKIDCLDANSRKTDTKWKAIIMPLFILYYIMLYTVEYIRESFLKNVNYSFRYFC